MPAHAQAPAQMSDLSLIKPLGYQRNTSCGYCKGTSGNSSYYISCNKLRVDHYQELVDRGWRRSGILFYKPDLPRSCCPHYTVRLDSSSFQATRDQRKVLHRWNRYILGPEYTRKAASLCPLSREEKRKRRDTFDLNLAVHASEYSNIKRPIDPSTKKPIEPAHRFEVTLESDAFSIEKYEILLPYQMRVHKDPKSRWSHRSVERFLCSGLDRKTVRSEGKTQKLGSYHQCYRLDGKLIAVGVLDLLPHGVSSVYLFYNPDFDAWQLGKLSALREIALAMEGQYRYYYMGYYIHSCIKMRYKAAYSPTFVLDPESLEWCSLDDDYRRKLDGNPYVSLSRERRLAQEQSLKADPKSLQDLREMQETPELGPTAEGLTRTVPTSSTVPETIDDNDYELDSEGSNDETEIPEGSLFDYNMPGVLTADEVAQLDLDHWKIVVRGRLVDFEDLVGWESSNITQPNSIKGIVAELVATIGPRVMQHSAVQIFG